MLSLCMQLYMIMLSALKSEASLTAAMHVSFISCTHDVHDRLNCIPAIACLSQQLLHNHVLVGWFVRCYIGIVNQLKIATIYLIAIAFTWYLSTT